MKNTVMTKTQVSCPLAIDRLGGQYTGRIGLAALKGKVQEVIPDQERVCLESYIRADTTSDCTIVKQTESSALPSEVFVECCLVTLPK